jgi:Protein of unknown function (DUF2281)
MVTSVNPEISQPEESTPIIKSRTTDLVDKFKELSLDQQKTVLEFVDYLYQKQKQHKKEHPRKPMILGSHEGKIWMSDDFDDSLF